MFLHAGDHFEDIERYNEITSLIDTFKLSKKIVFRNLLWSSVHMPDMSYLFKQ